MKKGSEKTKKNVPYSPKDINIEGVWVGTGKLFGKDKKDPIIYKYILDITHTRGESEIFSQAKVVDYQNKNQSYSAELWGRFINEFTIMAEFKSISDHIYDLGSGLLHIGANKTIIGGSVSLGIENPLEVNFVEYSFSCGIEKYLELNNQNPLCNHLCEVIKFISDSKTEIPNLSFFRQTELLVINHKSDSLWLQIGTKTEGYFLVEINEKVLAKYRNNDLKELKLFSIDKFDFSNDSVK